MPMKHWRKFVKEWSNAIISFNERQVSDEILIACKQKSSERFWKHQYFRSLINKKIKYIVLFNTYACNDHYILIILSYKLFSLYFCFYILFFCCIKGKKSLYIVVYSCINLDLFGRISFFCCFCFIFNCTVIIITLTVFKHM